jgi:hypothetical protein
MNVENTGTAAERKHCKSLKYNRSAKVGIGENSVPVFSVYYQRLTEIYRIHRNAERSGVPVRNAKSIKTPQDIEINEEKPERKIVPHRNAHSLEPSPPRSFRTGGGEG